MANNYNTHPIYIDTVMGAGWRSLQTLNTGTNAQGFPAQPGPRVYQVMWTNIPAAGDVFTIVEPVSGSTLLQGTCGTSLQDQLYNLVDRGGSWRDFQVTAISGGVLLIFYKT